MIPTIAFATLPSGSITNVERLIPVYVRPMYFFSPQTPYASASLCSGSASSRNGSSCFDLNFWCDWTGSGLTPITSTPCSRKRSYVSLNSQASVVQPGVSSLG